MEEGAGEDVDEEVEGEESVCRGGARGWVQFVTALDDGWGGGHAGGRDGEGKCESCLLHVKALPLVPNQARWYLAGPRHVVPLPSPFSSLSQTFL